MLTDVYFLERGLYARKWDQVVKGCGHLRRGLLVCVKGTQRGKRIGSYELVAATGEGSHNRECRFTKILFTPGSLRYSCFSLYLTIKVLRSLIGALSFGIGLSWLKVQQNTWKVENVKLQLRSEEWLIRRQLLKKVYHIFCGFSLQI